MTMITPSYLGETIEYSSLHACRSTLEDPTGLIPLILAILLAYDGYVKAKGEKGYINTEPALLYQ